jgi:peptidoglycan/LPS O-acetylase OafA/YrhL
LENRIEHVDGLRGIAILSVILYHAYSRWPGLVSLPYGERFAHFFGWGWLGVELFFIISGFVIFMSLDKCDSFVQFIGKRWLRLFPAMLIATALIFITAPLVHRPDGLPTFSQAVPGLTLIDPRWLARVGGPSEMLEGSFWSLFTEMKFYVFAGAVYFTLGRTWAILGLIAGFAGYWLCFLLDVQGPAWWAYLYDTPYWAWFACGALFYEWKRTEDGRLFAAAILVGFVASAVPMPGVGGIKGMDWIPFAGLPFVLLFAAALRYCWVQRMLCNRWLLFLGFVSYPLYLIHEQAVVGLSVTLGRNFNQGWLSGVVPLLPIAIVIAVSWVIAKFWEKPLRKAISSSAELFARFALKDGRVGRRT